ncbi:Thiamine pyrophosphokinase [Candidatus Thermoflexus japonica]|uniref:Thiamine diphosphokinase n=1 Tax=Candidatus Thermoflexus japonica TaxID=2035417 RepID=A0A2H5YA18_9CHLR|nr:Thiamine pyrophosphokinase [Candidatus Thermoflexus japonica]
MGEPEIILIVAGGEVDREALRRAVSQARWILAADGGAAHLRAIGAIPHRVIGDLDSMDPETLSWLEQAGVPIERHSVDKDATDLELALEYARKLGGAIRVFGAWGSRLDQTVASLLLLAHPRWVGWDIRFVGLEREAFVLQGEGWIEGEPGDRVSLIPLIGDAEGVTLEGLFYPLQEGVLPFGSTLGISNRMIAPRAHIRVRRGLLLVIHERGL